MKITIRHENDWYTATINYPDKTLEKTGYDTLSELFIYLARVAEYTEQMFGPLQALPVEIVGVLRR